MARARATRWRCPPLSAAGLRPCRSLSPRVPAASDTLVSRSALVSLRDSVSPSMANLRVMSGDSMFLATVMWG